jgi:hypothetical protein
MRNNQPNKGSNEAAATRANNKPNNSMEAWSTMVNGNGNGKGNGKGIRSSPWSVIQR